VRVGRIRGRCLTPFLCLTAGQYCYANQASCLLGPNKCGNLTPFPGAIVLQTAQGWAVYNGSVLLGASADATNVVFSGAQLAVGLLDLSTTPPTVSLGEACVESFMTCSTGEAGPLPNTFFCFSDTPRQATASGSGLLCYGAVCLGLVRVTRFTCVPTPETLDACLSGPNACESTSSPCVVTSGVCGTGPAAFQSGSGQLVELGASMKYFCPSTLPLNSMPNGVRLALFQQSRSSHSNSPGWDAVLHRLCGAFPSPSRQSACSLPYRAASMGQMRAGIRAQDSVMPETVRCQRHCA